MNKGDSYVRVTHRERRDLDTMITFFVKIIVHLLILSSVLFERMVRGVNRRGGGGLQFYICWTVWKIKTKNNQFSQKRTLLQIALHDIKRYPLHAQPFTDTLMKYTAKPVYT